MEHHIPLDPGRQQLTEAEFFNWLQKTIEVLRTQRELKRKDREWAYPNRQSLTEWIKVVLPDLHMRMLTGLRDRA